MLLREHRVCQPQRGAGECAGVTGGGRWVKLLPQTVRLPPPPSSGSCTRALLPCASGKGKRHAHAPYRITPLVTAHLPPMPITLRELSRQHNVHPLLLLPVFPSFVYRCSHPAARAATRCGKHACSFTSIPPAPPPPRVPRSRPSSRPRRLRGAAAACRRRARCHRQWRPRPPVAPRWLGGDAPGPT